MNIYDSIIEGAQYLPEKTRGQLYVAVVEYLYYEREPEFKLEPTVAAMFTAFKPTLDNQIAKQKAGQTGGKRKAERLANAKQTASKPLANAKQTASKTLADGLANAKQTPTEQEQEQEQEIEQEKTPKRAAKFTPPTVGEVAAYIAEKGYPFTAEEFVSYYTANGWKVGRNPMKDWRAACRTWASRREPKREEASRYALYD